MPPSMLSFSPAANTATKTTRPRPTISAADVIAVRPGLRAAFSRASSPVVPRRRSSGHPVTAASGRTAKRALAATPTKTSSVPAPIEPSRAVAVPPPSRPWTTSASPASAIAPVAMWRSAGCRGRRVCVSSRMAATGDTRVARTAGMSAAASVTPMPTARAITIVRPASSMSPRGIPMPAASKSAPSARAKPSPRKRPETDATVPTTRASTATEART